MKIEVGPTGKLIKGTVFDVNPKHLEERLQQYDKQLYLNWNASKTWSNREQKGIKQGETNQYGMFIPTRGEGVWEVKRRLPQKKAVFQGVYQGNSLFTVEENNASLLTHIVDVDTLNYQLVDYIISIDTWSTKDWTKQYEEDRLAYNYKEMKRADEELRYNIQQHKTLFKAWREMLASGDNPNRIMQYWGRK